MNVDLKISIKVCSENSRHTIAEPLLCGGEAALFAAVIFRIFGISWYMAIPVFFVAAALLFLSVNGKFRFHKFVFPAVIFLIFAADMIFRSRFISELTAAFNCAGTKIALKKSEIFLQFSGEISHGILLPLTFSVVLATLFAVFPRRAVAAVLAVGGVWSCAVFGENSAAAAALCAVAASELLSGSAILKSRKYAVLAGCLLLGAIGGYGLDLHTAAGSLSPVQAVKSGVDSLLEGSHGIEVVMEKPSPLYLRETTENPDVDTKSFSELSQQIYTVYQDGFYPAQSAAMLPVSGDSGRVTVNVKGKDGGQALVPYGVISGENVSPDLSSLSGDGYIAGDDPVYSYQVCTDFLRGYPELFDKVKRSSETAQIRDYLSLEQVCRDFAYEAYSRLSEADKNTIAANFDGNESGSVSEKISYIRNFLSENISLQESGGDFSLVNTLEISRCADEQGYALLTVCLARYCGLAARTAEGWYISAAEAEDIPENGAVTLSEDNRHVWAEFYLDGIGWLPLETYPDYMDDIPVAGFIADAQSEDAEAEANGLSACQPEAEDIPPQADEIISEKTGFSYSALMAYAVGIAAALLILRIAAARVYALAVRRKIYSKNPEISALSAHRQGLELLARAGIDTDCAPEKIVGRLESSIAADFENSEKIYEKIRFSQNGISAEEAAVCREFYVSAQNFYRSSTCVCRRALRRIFTGIY